MSGMVREDSAMLVLRMTFLWPCGSGGKMLECSSLEVGAQHCSDLSFSQILK